MIATFAAVMMSRLSAAIYPEYARVFRYMTGKDAHPNYVRMTSTSVRALNGSSAMLETPNGEITVGPNREFCPKVASYSTYGRLETLPPAGCLRGTSVEHTSARRKTRLPRKLPERHRSVAVRSGVLRRRPLRAVPDRWMSSSRPNASDGSRVPAATAMRPGRGHIGGPEYGTVHS